MYTGPRLTRIWEGEGNLNLNFQCVPRFIVDLNFECITRSIIAREQPVERPRLRV